MLDRSHWMPRCLALHVLCLLLGTEVLAEDKSCHAEHPENNGRYTRTLERYTVPDLELINQNGEKVDLTSVLDPGWPVALNFVFTTCTTICPVMTATFSKVEQELGDEAGDLRLVSISIDPEYDTPGVLESYARRYGAGSRWQFLTGDAAQVTKVLRAFNALTGSKMNHRPFTLFRIPGDEHWVRIEGLTSASDLVREYRRLVAE